ncbi:MAG: FAD-dependent oxidoreductase [Bryobacteraceae bacterium]
MNNRIVILGGGIGGRSVARALRFVHADITVVDREPSHTLPSHLYSIAVGKQRPSTALPPHAKVLHGEAVYLDARRQRLLFADRALPYDVLVVATGVRARYERSDWERFAPSLKSADDARRIREKLQDLDSTVVVVGGGVAGVELAAAVTNQHRRVVIAEQGPRLLATFPESLAEDALRQLQGMGVEVRFGLHAVGVDAESVRFSGPKGREQILSRAVLWAGGVEGSSFGTVLRSETGVALDEAGRVCVNPDLTVPGHPEIFVIGDLARTMDQGRPLEGLATVASQQGRYVASSIRERMAGYTAKPFAYVDQGRFAVLGRGGVGLLGDTQLRGTASWLAAKLAQMWSSPEPILRRPLLKPEMRVSARWSRFRPGT